MLAYANSRHNLAHCFASCVNVNTINLLQVCDYPYLDAAAHFERWGVAHDSGLGTTRWVVGSR